jgi:acetylornithine/N-succinyldiaminopimelate aminotransferase
LRSGLDTLAREEPAVFTQIRGCGLMLGLVCGVPNTELQAACLAQGLLVVAAGENVVRLMPPLVATAQDCDEAVAMLRRAAQHCRPALLQEATT